MYIILIKKVTFVPRTSKKDEETTHYLYIYSDVDLFPQYVCRR